MANTISPAPRKNFSSRIARTLHDRIPVRRTHQHRTQQYYLTPSTWSMIVTRDISNRRMRYENLPASINNPHGIEPLSMLSSPECEERERYLHIYLMASFIGYYIMDPSLLLAQMPTTREHIIETVVERVATKFGNMSSTSCATSSEPREHSPNCFPAERFLELFSRFEFGSLTLSSVVEEKGGPQTENEDTSSEDLNEIMELRAFPFHNQVDVWQYHYDQYERLYQYLQSRGVEHWDKAEQWTEYLNDFEGALSDDSFDRICRLGLSIMQRLLRVVSSENRTFSVGIRFIQVCMLINKLLAESGVRASILQELNCLGPLFLIDEGENGYTRTFIGGRRYRIGKIRRELLRRNSGAPPRVSPDVVTVAISYRHFWMSGRDRKTRRHRICRLDLEAIASFIEASHASRLRFWVDSKLPPTNDGSFERWLTRGVRPYARYMTIICPSADASQDRFWIANEKYISNLSRGVFYFRGNGIYFDRGLDEFSMFANHFLHLMIGEQGLPPGVRDEDEVKVHQWALGVLGSAEKVNAMHSGPRPDQLYSDNYTETRAIRHIEDVVKQYGPLSLPLVPGTTWNKQNPLMKGTLGHQAHQMVNWIGLVHPEDKQTIFFSHVYSLRRINEPNYAVLRVRLRKAFDEPDGNAIEQKDLMAVDTDTLREMVPVVVPASCDW